MESKGRNVIRIFFSFGYDVQQIVKDLPDETIDQLMHGQTVWFNTPEKAYKIQYIPHKIFIVNNIRFYDVFSFWGTSFVRACDETFPNEKLPPELREGKKGRSDFGNEEEWSNEKVLRYNFIELDYLVRLGEHLQRNFLAADIHIGKSYYGPGAVAEYWFSYYDVNPIPIPSEFNDIMERAYFGGRFEQFEIGTFNHEVYEADINSAYPSHIASLPYLDQWRRVTSQTFNSAPIQSVWLVEWHLPEKSKIGPFPSRDKDGRICYPKNGLGWYWKPEVDAALAFYSDKAIQIREGVAPQVVFDQPMEWVREKYAIRQRLKKEGDPTEWAYKVGLNSLYGKTAQRVGKAKYFNLAWAGYVTSATRAQLLRAAMDDPDNVIGFATDAAFFKRKPNLPDSNELGGWKVDRFTKGVFFASGVYKLWTPKEKWKKNKYGVVYNRTIDRSRGIHAGVDALIDSLKEHPTKMPEVKFQKFVSHIEGLRAPDAYGPWRARFMPASKQIAPYVTTKRKMLEHHVIEIQTDTQRELLFKIVKYGFPFAEIKIPGLPNYTVGFWYDYSPILKKPITMTILENHNDHSHIMKQECGPLELSYPFRDENFREAKIIANFEEIAGERLGDDDDELTPLPKDTPVKSETEIISG